MSMPDVNPGLGPIQVVIEEDGDAVKRGPDGSLEIKQPDGGVVVQFNSPKAEQENDEGHFDNLAEDMDITTLNTIANDLYEAVEADDKSRSGKLADIARGLDLLGIKLSEPRSDVAESSSPVDGMSSVVNPLLLEACLKGWANSQAELLPASGPCKVQDFGEGSQKDTELAGALERDMNWYLTVGAPEYYPDTSGMLLWGTYFSGGGFKKVYRCPLRRRPVSDSVDVKDLIVSDTTKDFRACERITHQTKVRTSTMRRLKLIGEITGLPATPPSAQQNQVEMKVDQIQGTQQNRDRPEDEPYTIWEIQCELMLPEFMPKKYADEKVALPFRVIMDKDSRQILSMRRDWNPDDDECQRKRLYVKYPYVPGPGFYGTGLLNILGNSSAAMTAAWRESLDAGMFANFPAGLVAELSGRQKTNDMRLAPGTLKPIQTNGAKIQDMVMGLPYKDVTPGLLALIDKITAQAKEVGGVADMPSGEGLQNIPVGTMLANIEQATKIMAAAHKGMHTAQSEEIQMIADLFRENPEDFWRGNKVAPKNFWDEQKLLLALDTVTLVPQSDPNVPSHLHRIMKALGLVNLIAVPQFAQIMDAKETLRRILTAIREDPAGLVKDPPPQEAAPDLVGNAKLLEAQTKAKKLQVDSATQLAKSQDVAKEQQTKIDLATMDLAKEMVMHSDKVENEQNRQALEAGQHLLDMAQARHDATMDVHAALQPPKAPTP